MFLRQNQNSILQILEEFTQKPNSVFLVWVRKRNEEEKNPNSVLYFWNVLPFYNNHILYFKQKNNLKHYVQLLEFAWSIKHSHKFLLCIIKMFSHSYCLLLIQCTQRFKQLSEYEGCKNQSTVTAKCVFLVLLEGLPVAQWWRIRLLRQETLVWFLVREIPWSSKWQPTPVFHGIMDSKASWTTVHGVAKNWTWLSDQTCTHSPTRNITAGPGFQTQFPQTWTEEIKSYYHSKLDRKFANLAT